MGPGDIFFIVRRNSNFYIELTLNPRQVSGHGRPRFRSQLSLDTDLAANLNRGRYRHQFSNVQMQHGTPRHLAAANAFTEIAAVTYSERR
jgi:hypothetical protein